jgi:demethylmenaquinone methyltransferase/2-methoxy-6-polyprenyl-1,4-benzoquinol methylase
MSARPGPTFAGSPLGQPNDPASTAAEVRRMFAAVAPRYDLLNHVLSLGSDFVWRRAAAKALADVLARPESVVADLCCGTGDMALALERRSAGRVIGADFCFPMLALARQKSSGRIHLHFLEADSLRLPFADAALDAVTIAFGFRNLANYRQGLREMCRALKPRGQVAILEFSQVRGRVVGPLFRFYFRRVLPALGARISGVAGAYQYLPESVARFPDQESLAVMMREAGLTGVHYRNLMRGVAALHLGTKTA